MNQNSFEGVLGVFLRVFEPSSKEVLKQFEGSLQRFSSKFLGVSWKMSRMFQVGLKGVLWKCQKCFTEVARCFKKVSWLLQGNFKGVSRVFHT